jgi:protein-S-isoprenylcysteine O-methyltransferase Ste14
MKRGKLSPVSALLEFVFFALHANSMYLFVPVKWPNLPPLAKDTMLYYPSLIVMTLGFISFVFAISYPSFYIIGWIIVFGIIANLMVITEEEYLFKIYGEEYESYSNNVPRYLNFNLFG